MEINEVFGCPECGSKYCHRKIDQSGGSGNSPIPVYGRTFRKLRDLWCDNGCNCSDCKEYWAKMDADVPKEEK
jgi:hypothetical protein